MLEEIRQQPSSLERTLEAARGAVQELRGYLSRRKPQLIVLAARGTSDNAAQFGRYLLEITTGIPVSLAAPSVTTLYGAKLRLEKALVVGISQSGESTDINMFLESARAQGALTVGVTNEGTSTLARLARHSFVLAAGRETSVPATKTYTSQLLAMYLLAHALGAPIELEDLERLPDWTRSALGLEPQIAALAEKYASIEHAIIVGRGLDYANALEFGLKLMEACYVVAERFSGADLLHGPIALVEKAFPVFVFAPPGATWPGTRDIVSSLGRLGARTLIITDRSNPEAAGMPGDSVVIPAEVAGRSSLPCEFLTPIPYIVPAQLFTAHLARSKGLNPDQPRTLTKVTRTV
jgi:glucosamine--fructose-6-phosphate aminotransferase (isomerizing)